MKELEVIKQLPVINANFEDVKASLSETLNKYKGIVVTEEGLKDCKATQKELSSIRVKIDNYRKTIKKEVLVPVTDFENNCKELEKLITEVENPIKEGINVFDNQRREEKRIKALEFITEAIESHELKEKYSRQLNVLDKYITLTGSVKAVREDIEMRAESLKMQQDSEEKEIEQTKESINAYAATFNEDITLKIKPDEFYKYIGNNDLTRILSFIKNQHDKIKEAENPKPIEQPKEEIKVEPVKEQVTIPADLSRHQEPEKEQLYFYDLKITANFNNCKRLIELLKSGGFNYEVKEKGRV